MANSFFQETNWRRTLAKYTGEVHWRSTVAKRTGEVQWRSTLTYKCDICDEHFSRKNILYFHMRKHMRDQLL